MDYLPCIDDFCTPFEDLSVLFCNFPQASRRNIPQLCLLVSLRQSRKVRAAHVIFDLIVTIRYLLVNSNCENRSWRGLLSLTETAT